MVAKYSKRKTSGPRLEGFSHIIQTTVMPTSTPVSKQGTTEEDVARTAVKFDIDKVRTHLFPIRAYLSACQGFDYGAEKYDEGNWKSGQSFLYSRLLSAGDRHRKAFALGQNTDSLSRLPHLALAICNDAMLLELSLTGKGVDDRAVSQIVQMTDTEIDMYVFNRYIQPAKKK